MKNSSTCALSRTVALRCILVVSLLAAAGVCAALSYISLRDSEREVGRQTYESIAASALNGARATTTRKVQGSEVMATMLSYQNPHKEQWPFIDLQGYIPIAQKVAALSSSTTQSLATLLDPVDVGAWENHTRAVYTQQGRPDGAGVSDFGFGIWRNDPDSPFQDGRVHDVTGETTWGGQAGILTPIMHHNKPGASSLLYNIYSEADRGVYLDRMFACVHNNKNSDNPVPYPSCATITDMLELKVRPGPAGLLFLPVFPANANTEIVGFAVTSIHWQEVLDAVVPSYVSGLTCIISTSKTSFTYEIQQGVPQLLGEGDLHDPAYEHLARSAVLNDFIGDASAVYTLTVYPTQAMFDTFTTNSPVKVAVGFCGVILLCTLVFYFYDCLMRHEAQQRRLILEMKRRFVRFISHEIRTPLNTVCMGLELLTSELKRNERKVEKTQDDEGALSWMAKQAKEDLDFWHQVTLDIEENAHVAVGILTDLLNYDKLEAGLMKLEVDRVDIWDLVHKVVGQMQIQAANRRVHLRVHIDTRQPLKTQDSATDLEKGSDAASVNLSELAVIGENIKLMQVLRNVISNALKFTPSDGIIQVTATHVPKGLPNAPTLLTEGEDGTRRPAFNHPQNGSVQISVKDSGVGMTKVQLSQLFREGVQFDAEKLQHGGGSGLGLHIAKGMVEQHNGTITADSQGIHKGTTFTIELPLYEFPATAFDKDQPHPDKHSITEQSLTTGADDSEHDELALGPKRILVVEDSASSRKMLMRLLERSGYACVAASNGREAVSLVSDDMAAAAAADPEGFVPIDAILMDFEMPLLNGPEATKEIRERLGFKGQIIGVTGNVLSEDVDFFRESGADEVFCKPISLECLRDYWKHVAAGGLKRSRPSTGSLRLGVQG